MACLPVGHCLRRSEVGGPVGQGGEGIQFFGAKSRRGGQQQELGPWGRGWLQFLIKLRVLNGFHPDRGSWHGSGEALGKTLVRLLEKENDSVARLREVGGGPAQAPGRPDADHHALGRMEDPRGRENVH